MQIANKWWGDAKVLESDYVMELKYKHELEREVNIHIIKLELI